jgi:choline-glycine betaine transporter
MMIDRFFSGLPLVARTMPVLLLLTLIVVQTASESAAQGCAMCQTVMPQGNDPMAGGLFWGMLILLTAPFLVVGLIGAWLYYRSRNTKHTSPTTLGMLLPTHEHRQN